MSFMNYPAFFVTLSTICLLAAHLLAPSAVLSIVLVVVLPLVTTAALFNYLEGHQYQDKWVSAELEDYEADPDYDCYVSLCK